MYSVIWVFTSIYNQLQLLEHLCKRETSTFDYIEKLLQRGRIHFSK